jgi:hypothetical protein
MLACFLAGMILLGPYSPMPSSGADHSAAEASAVSSSGPASMPGNPETAGKDDGCCTYDPCDGQCVCHLLFLTQPGLALCLDTSGDALSPGSASNYQAHIPDPLVPPPSVG